MSKQPTPQDGKFKELDHKLEAGFPSQGQR
jgi:hypothetical protein